MSQPDVRKGMPSRRLDRGTFEKRFKSAFVDPVFSPLQRELQAITDAAWDAYDDSRKAPITRKAGPGFADPDYDIAVDWLPHPHHQWLVSHRAYLSRRNVEVLAAGRDRTRDH